MPLSKPTIGFISDEAGLASMERHAPNKDGKGPFCLAEQFSSDVASRLTMDYSGEQVAAGSIAVFSICGYIYYDRAPWYFSTRNFIQDIKTADENPAISAHLLYIDTPGGEAFGLPEAFETIRSLKKPVYAFVDSMAASAGYYFAAGAKKIYAGSIFSNIGCIGAMAEMYDDTEYDKNMGFRRIVLRSAYSPLKNKMAEDVVEGHPEEYIRERLDPLAEKFILDVRSARPDIKEDSDALKGKIYFAAVAQGEGLIDGVMKLDEVLDEIAADCKLPQNDEIYSIIL